MRCFRFVSTFAATTFAFGLLVVGRGGAWAATVPVSGSFSGTTDGVLFDFDNDTIVPNSVEITVAGKQSPGGGFTLRGVAEADPAPGTGCPAAPTTQASCSVDGVASCLYNFVGGVGAFRFDSNGDISSFQVASGTTCLQVTPPFNFNATEVINYTGGSGKFADATGSATIITSSGRVLSLDTAGHAFSWIQSNYSGSITFP